MATYITSDLHGNLEKFKKLLEQIRFDCKTDHMYIEKRLEKRKWKKWGGGNTAKKIDQMTRYEKKEFLTFLRALSHNQVIKLANGEDAVLTHSGIHADYIIQMCADEAHTIFLGISHLMAFDGFNDTVRLLLWGTKQSGSYFFVVDGIVRLFN